MADQGFSYLAQGCTQCIVHWQGGRAVRPALVITERVNRRWWTCPMCGGSYGEVDLDWAVVTLGALCSLISDDAHAMSFQTTRQYRTSLLQDIARQYQKHKGHAS
jgi:hypothetical protein